MNSCESSVWQLTKNIVKWGKVHMITPIELNSKVFNKSGLGYEKKDVDGFMKEVALSYEFLYKENVELKDKVNVLNEGIQYYKTIEKTIQKALVLAEQTAEETREAARQNAKSIEEKAKVKADLIVEDAKRQLNEIHQKTIQLIEQYDRYKLQYKNLAKTQVELLESDSFQIQIANLEAFMKQEDTEEITDTNSEKSEVVDENQPEESSKAAKDEFEFLPIEEI